MMLNSTNQHDWILFFLHILSSKISVGNNRAYGGHICIVVLC